MAKEKSIAPDVIYIKTAKGQAEIQNRAYHMPPRIRALLLMIDGLRTASDWIEQVSRIGGGEDWLQYLLAQGFIRDINEPEAEREAAAEKSAAVEKAAPSPELIKRLTEAKAIMRYCVRNCTGFEDSRALNKLLDLAHSQNELLNCLNAIVKKLENGPQAAMIGKMREQVLVLLQ